ncbi:ABC transporter permease [Leadbettera azotonutricia]|uniref:Oligopeptide ABC transporter, permease protein n=1 Tax=Leadbettera azotonutricia (strain ATCC BAA-888 / DSM 13862 / ZAS-9) TaxID=545695 RepID=F5Y6S2_LEAAZ|nr:ABC transporter permease [Leadbettera azotonutricia]AEF80806.1 oligopeptide ABC transporter, permease protein [Leadbettera azotonutricia ZAS-9]
MGYFLKTVFKSGKFCFGFSVIVIILLLITIYPMFDTRDPLDMAGGFFERPNMVEYINRNKEGGQKAASAVAEVDQATTDLLAQFGMVMAEKKEQPIALHILGTDNFGRDMMAQLVAGTKTSLVIGLLAGTIATLIGLTIGLLAGYLGGQIDNFLSSITNIFLVIPSFVILVLVSVSVSTRSFLTTGIIIGVTSWPWTARAVRSQTTSLRNRDHVNLSKLSGHSMPRIIIKDILPYIASYVVMAFILQVASGILSEASISMLGLGPRNVATLGLMMNWAGSFNALFNGNWWAFLPMVLMISLITFSLNLMNSGLDQIFNPQIRS